jgi:UDP-N-acetylglucosamine--N-acetylmuramyl-(pentapeptide) pyrophosphoryl-undecaprenol N-acetylglucosamine transferase
MSQKKVNILISGGGTGGHIYPAIAIANELKSRIENANFLFVGAKDRMEMEKVPAAGYPIKGLWISGVQRRFTLQNFWFPFKLFSSLFRASRILTKFKPDIVIGTGGFASGPVLYVAANKKIPTLIQEQNSYPGITNKLLSKKVNKICVSYDHLERFFPKNKMVKTGNPVRQDLLDVPSKKEEAQDFFGLDKSQKTLLILGGSLGARKINQLVESQLDFLEQHDVQIVWQCGKLYAKEYQKYADRKNVQVHAFLNRMDLAYAAADIIISRAGASSISELCIVGKPTLFIPSPNVSEDHQTKNANAVVSQNAALMIRESELENFQKKFTVLLQSEDVQENLSKNMKKLALPNATKIIVDEIEKLVKRLS